MKKIILIVAAQLLCAFQISAEVRFQSINNIGGTNIVLVDNDPPSKMEMTEAVFTDDGCEYRAEKIRSDLKDGKAVYTLRFKRLTLFRDCRLTVIVNGEKKFLDIQKELISR